MSKPRVTTLPNGRFQFSAEYLAANGGAIAEVSAALPPTMHPTPDELAFQMARDEAKANDAGYTVTDCTEWKRGDDGRITGLDAWLPKEIKANIKRLDAHKKGTNALVPSSSFSFKPAPAFIEACRKMDALPLDASAADKNNALGGMRPYYGFTVAHFTRARKQLETLGWTL